ncbi:phenylacetate-CoA ligase [Thermodesulfitimonas autotrophica]|uniref:Phenylacetate-coenzyme A ligase n=1 Tax=Thermodesulfitimonas autotrophica TaxID=1894989 RepID=A0A3N5AWN1_9THEO|nr:phenylacetate--CoA ligase [Thermodesulfitimonas autotrophica]RPF49327.1 phenylacetate-CoA ligase [Thermodesulfitimonas autotrophica]
MWNPAVETMPREQLRELQLQRLKETVRRAYEKVPFYREKFKAIGLEPGDIKSLDDLARLPFTFKDDLRNNYPFGLFAAPLKEIVRIHASSGTTGKPTVVGYTREDIATWAEVVARTLGSVNTTPDDVVQVAYGYGLFTGGLGLHYGAEKLGATVIPISGGNTKRQIMLMQDFGTTVLCCTPSYALYIAEVLRESGIPRESLRLRAGLFGAEPWSENMRREIEEKLKIDAIDIYGLSEIIGPGVASECLCKNGLHICEDHFIPEIIDPATGKVLPPGEQGELVFTTITKQGFPVIRYRTRDISRLIDEPCPCGRTHIRMARVTGRTDDMLIIRGVNVFPTQIESVLLSIGQTEPHYLLVVDREKSLDTLEVWVEVSEALFRDEVKGLEELERRIHDEIESVLGISVKVKLVEPKTIQRSEGKAKRVWDKRDLLK